MITFHLITRHMGTAPKKYLWHLPLLSQAHIPLQLVPIQIPPQEAVIMPRIYFFCIRYLSWPEIWKSPGFCPGKIGFFFKFLGFGKPCVYLVVTPQTPFPGLVESTPNIFFCYQVEAYQGHSPILPHNGEWQICEPYTSRKEVIPPGYQEILWQNNCHRRVSIRRSIILLSKQQKIMHYFMNLYSSQWRMLFSSWLHGFMIWNGVLHLPGHFYIHIQLY